MAPIWSNYTWIVLCRISYYTPISYIGFRWWILQIQIIFRYLLWIAIFFINHWNKYKNWKDHKQEGITTKQKQIKRIGSPYSENHMLLFGSSIQPIDTLIHTSHQIRIDKSKIVLHLISVTWWEECALGKGPKEEWSDISHSRFCQPILMNFVRLQFACGLSAHRTLSPNESDIFYSTTTLRRILF